jgi:hypothetical protein
VDNPEEKRQQGRYRRRWEDNIKVCLREVGSGSMNRIDMARDRGQWRAIVNTVINTAKFFEYLHNWRSSKKGISDNCLNFFERR